MQPSEAFDLMKLLSLLVGTIGVFFAAFSLKATARANQFKSLIDLQKMWNDSEQVRRDVRYLRFQIDETDKAREKLRTTTDVLNMLATIFESKLVSQKLILTLYAVEIIRLTYRLEPFFKTASEKIGIPYGRRVIRLRNRASRYCCIRSNLKSDIYVYDEQSRAKHIAFKYEKKIWNKPHKRIEAFVRNFLEVY